MPVSPSEAAAEKQVWSNAVKWTTASEVDNFGYDVYRSTSPDGPFERLNPEVIEGAGTSDEVHAYRYVDAAIDPYTTYYYYVESISMSGVRKRFTPVGEAPAKLPAAKEDEGEEDSAGPSLDLELDLRAQSHGQRQGAAVAVDEVLVRRPDRLSRDPQLTARHLDLVAHQVSRAVDLHQAGSG